ncbi:MAG TPA: hypothetical protein DD440_07670 [Porticoccaceae bacterium]|nr:hypothetical protein [Porticoccaceae bacterium]
MWCEMARIFWGVEIRLFRPSCIIQIQIFLYDDGCSGVVRNASLETLTLGVICQISEQGERPMYRLFLAFFPFECMRN